MCVIDLKHFPVITLRQKPSRCLAGGGGGVWENAVSSPSGAINFGVFSLFESVANARYRIVKPVTTLSLNQTHLFSELDCSQPQIG